MPVLCGPSCGLWTRSGKVPDHNGEHPTARERGYPLRSQSSRRIKVNQGHSLRFRANQYLNGDLLPSANVNGCLSPGAFYTEKEVNLWTLCSLIWTLKETEHNGQSSPVVMAAFPKAPKKRGNVLYKKHTKNRERSGKQINNMGREICFKAADSYHI